MGAHFGDEHRVFRFEDQALTIPDQAQAAIAANQVADIGQQAARHLEAGVSFQRRVNLLEGHTGGPGVP